MDEWSYSEWIVVDALFIPCGEYWYPVHIDRFAEAIRNCIEIVADAVQKVIERIGDALSDLLPPIILAMEESKPAPPRPHWKPVQYIRVNDRRTDRRSPVHHIRNALPNMRKDRRTRREAAT